jgi:hypothetical protein
MVIPPLSGGHLRIGKGDALAIVVKERLVI